METQGNTTFCEGGQWASGAHVGPMGEPKRDYGCTHGAHGEVKRAHTSAEQAFPRKKGINEEVKRAESTPRVVRERTRTATNCIERAQ